MKLTSLLLLLLPFAVTAQKHVLSAMEIVQRAIDSTGGDVKFASINELETFDQIVTPSGDTLSVAVKKMQFNKYYVSTLSNGYANSTTIYNQGKAEIINGGIVEPLTSPVKLEELQLNCYTSFSYAYKKLGYKLSRLEDQTFDKFDCYLVSAQSPLGRTYTNFYDKKKGNLLMVVHPSGNRTVYMEWFANHGVLYPLRTLLGDITAGKVVRGTLRSVDDDPHLDTNWFAIQGKGSDLVPRSFREGNFRYLGVNAGNSFVRTKDTQVETGKIKYSYKVEWTSDRDYWMYTDPAIRPAQLKEIEYIRVRIISWQGNRCYCQYINSGMEGGTWVIEKTP